MSSPYSNPYASPTTQSQYGGGMPTPDAKPVAITVFGILNLVLVLWVCAGLEQASLLWRSWQITLVFSNRQTPYWIIRLAMCGTSSRWAWEQ